MTETNNSENEIKLNNIQMEYLRSYMKLVWENAERFSREKLEDLVDQLAGHIEEEFKALNRVGGM